MQHTKLKIDFSLRRMSRHTIIFFSFSFRFAIVWALCADLGSAERRKKWDGNTRCKVVISVMMNNMCSRASNGEPAIPTWGSCRRCDLQLWWQGSALVKVVHSVEYFVHRACNSYGFPLALCNLFEIVAVKILFIYRVFCAESNILYRIFFGARQLFFLK